MKDQPEFHDSSSRNQSTSNTNEQKGTQPESSPWFFYVLIAVIALGVLGLVGKALGIF